MRSLRTFLFALVVLVLSAPFAFADVRADEMTSTSAAGLEFHYPERFAPAARKLVEIAPETVARVERSLGLDALGPVQVWVLPEVDDYFEVTGTPGNPPKWAVGLSLSDRGVIIVVNGAGPNGALVELEKTFEHELAHVAIDRARRGHPIPRWFNEGYALLQADEWTPERADVFGRAASAGALKPFAEIERTFPEHSASAGLAYSQSLQFVMHLQDTAGQDVIARIMRQVGEGKSFEHAFASAVGSSLALTEAVWRQDAAEQMSGWSILNDGTWGFFGASILFIVAWLVRRKRARSKLAAMPDDAAEWDYEESRYPLPGSAYDAVK